MTRPNGMRSLRVVLALLSVLVLTERDSAEDKIPQVDHVVTASCPKIPSPDLFSMPRQKLPAGFVTAQVIRCRWGFRYLAGKGKWEVVVEEHADGPADGLMKELRRPSESSFFPPMCTMEAVLVDYFVVVDSSGKAVLPKLPTGICGKPFRSALDALRHLPFQVDGQIPVRMLESEKSFQAGCYKKYLDVLQRFGRPKGPQTRNRPRTWNPAPEGLRVCIFRTANKTSDRPDPVDIPWGRFESSRILKGRSMRALLAALDSAPASDCPSHHTRFAILDPGYSEAYVELDGCRNLLRPDGTLGRLTPDAVALLTK
ncbi:MULTISPECIES: hypothetical protein [Nonomuraea]|uniref:Uncharacterized protein n=1 Tax=Nonomuraea mangrovi TaxID=2316207 RepID=A0ABW4SMS6_9ACTN